jgi:CHASE2 domain-containing sensor protein
MVNFFGKIKASIYAHRIYHRDVFFTSLFAMFFYFVASTAFHLFNSHFIDPVSTSLKDFEFSDIYFSTFRSKETVPDPNIVLINTGVDRPSFREDLAQMIEIVANNSPATIGIDHYFPPKPDNFEYRKGDSALANAIKKFPSIITTCVYNSEDSNAEQCMEGSDSSFNLVNEGYNNIVARSNETIRYFLPYVKNNSGGIDKTYESFALRIVHHFTQGGDPYQYVLENNDGNTAEWINYSAKDTNWYDTPDILNLKTNNGTLSWVQDSIAFKNAVQGKIVLFGFLGTNKQLKTLEDIYVTPIDKSYGGIQVPQTYGVQIQASIISTILNKDYIKVASDISLYLRGFLVCWLAMYMLLFLYIKHPAFFHVGSRGVQIVFSTIIVVYYLYLLYATKLDVSTKTVLTPLLLSVEAVYLFDFFIQLLKRKWSFKTFYTHEH